MATLSGTTSFGVPFNDFLPSGVNLDTVVTAQS
jgi:hypothetical protein